MEIHFHFSLVIIKIYISEEILSITNKFLKSHEMFSPTSNFLYFEPESECGQFFVFIRVFIVEVFFDSLVT